ncbi:MAG: AMP-binding protein [Alphaproteobacteria bacterium]|nr:AMP-binding protein [Alphaproteobacteria bacterium]
MSASVMNLGRLLADTARRLPDRAALWQAGRRWTWSEIDAEANAIAAGFAAMGLAPGDRVFVLSRNNPPMFVSMWACFKAGLVWVPANFRLSPPEIGWLVKHCRARALVYDPLFAPHVDAVAAELGAGAPAVVAIAEARAGERSWDEIGAGHRPAPSVEVDVAYDHPCWFFYTSGTTGRPKASILTHGQLNFVVNNHLADLMPGTTESDVSLVVAPLSHGAGAHALSQVARGAMSVLMPSERLDVEEAWRLVEHHRVTNMFTVPTIVKLLIEHPAVDRYDHASLRYVIYAGAPMYRADQKLALTKLGKVLVQYFGLGEVTGNITVLPPHLHTLDDDAADARIGTCGYPRTGMEIKIVDGEGRRLGPGERGEICTRGLAVFAGYFENPEATAKALKGGWFHTGDLGYLDAQGFLYITGRASDMYISGGSNVYPRDAEEVLLTHPAVSEVAVLGVPDPKWGEAGVAVVVRQPGAGAGEAELIGFLDGKLAKYKWPRRVFFWDELPKSGYGKVPKHLIRQKLYDQGALRQGEGI